LQDKIRYVNKAQSQLSLTLPLIWSRTGSFYILPKGLAPKHSLAMCILRSLWVGDCQRDQIGRLFASWATFSMTLATCCQSKAGQSTSFLASLTRLTKTGRSPPAEKRIFSYQKMVSSYSNLFLDRNSSHLDTLNSKFLSHWWTFKRNARLSWGSVDARIDSGSDNLALNERVQSIITFFLTRPHILLALLVT